MIASTVSNHDILLIVAVILFFVAAALHGYAKSLTGVLLCVGLALFSWSFLVVDKV